jgi:adenylylsulfate kinase
MSEPVRDDGLSLDEAELARRRERIVGRRGCVVWLTGLSGSGKSTIARALEWRLLGEGRLAYVLDGDRVRCGLNRDLGFSPVDRQENIRRLGEVAGLFADAGIIAITAFISPYRQGRAEARRAVPKGRFVEVFVDAPLEVCRQRDPKGLYRRVEAGALVEFTGMDAPYEPPEAPELVLRSAQQNAEQCADALWEYLQGAGLLGEEKKP